MTDANPPALVIDATSVEGRTRFSWRIVNGPDVQPAKPPVSYATRREALAQGNVVLDRLLSAARQRG